MKKILLSLFVSFVWLVGFSNWINLNWIDTFIATWTFTVPTITANYWFTSVYDTNNTFFKNYCIYVDNVSSYWDIIVRFDASSSRTASSTIQGWFLLEPSFSYEFSNDFNIFCTNWARRYYWFSYPKSSAWITFDYYIFDSTQLNNKINNLESNLDLCKSDLSECQNSSCQSDLLQCQSDYTSCSSSLWNCWTSLNSCQNALWNCMQGNYWTWINWSILNINWIEFPWKPLINVNIPDYITWDYSSTDANFDLNVGSGYDQDYIDSIISINSYRPTSEDFTNVFVSGLTLIFPYIVIVLFIIFVRKLIRRIFK